MNPKKCPHCSKKLKQKSIKYISPITKYGTTEYIEVPGVIHLVCSNKDCEFTTMSQDQSEKILTHVDRLSNYQLAPIEIAEIRQSLPFKTKTNLAQFLRLNTKAFIKWETGKTSPNPAYELLLRLVAFDQRNITFIKSLYKKQFRYDRDDYQFVSRYLNIVWKFPKPELIPNNNYSSQSMAAFHPAQDDAFSNSITIQNYTPKFGT